MGEKDFENGPVRANNPHFEVARPNIVHQIIRRERAISEEYSDYDFGGGLFGDDY